MTLHANESSTSGSSLSSSTTRLSSGSSSYLLSLYETHREKLGHPRTIPDSIRRYFKYKHATPFSSFPSTPQSIPSTPHALTKQRSEESTGSIETSFSYADEIALKTTLPANDRSKLFTPDPKFQTLSPKIPLSCNSTPKTHFPRQTCKLILAKTVDGGTIAADAQDNVFREPIQSDSSFEISSDWESLSLSALSDVDTDYNELCNSVKASQLSQDTEELHTPRRVSSESSLSSEINVDNKTNFRSKPMSIDIHFVVNPLLKRTHLTSQTEMCKSFDSFSTNTDELIARAQSFKELNILTGSSRLNSEIYDQSSDVSSVDTSELLSEKSFESDPYVNANANTLLDRLGENLRNSGLPVIQNENKADLIALFSQSMFEFIQVFANTLAQCIVDFAVLDAASMLIASNKIENFDINEDLKPLQKAVDVVNFDFDDEVNRTDIYSAADLVNFSDIQTEKILTEVLNNVFDERKESGSSLTMQKTELFYTIPITQYISLDIKKEFDKLTVTNQSVSSSSKTVIRWLERKGCYRTVFSVQFKDNESAIWDPYENPRLDFKDDFREDFVGSKTLDFNPLNYRLVECVVDDLIPITRSFSTGFIDNCYDSALLDKPPRQRSASLDSFFTLTCKPVSSNASLDKQFIAVPVNRLKSPAGESGVFLSSSTVERFSSEDDNSSDKVEEFDKFYAFENISISSGATDFSSSSVDDCDIIQAELLEKSKISDRPHFVSHKSRIDEMNESVPQNVSVPFELKPELVSLQEKDEEDDDKSLESFNAALENESHYEDAFSTTGAAETALQDLPENAAVNTISAAAEESALKDVQNNKTRKISIVGKKGAKSFDWYVGEDLVEQRRSKLWFLFALICLNKF